ncbi:Glutathione S-transferase D5 [Blattella germanica]|nr:Glutathione S-transferase D5 [Blattella germanica]
MESCFSFKLPILYQGKSPNPEHVAAFGQPIELLDKFLEGHEWVAGDHITIADYAIVCTISHMEANGYDMSKHPNVHRWLTKTKKAIPSYKDIVPPGIVIILDMFKAAVKS